MTDVDRQNSMSRFYEGLPPEVEFCVYPVIPSDLKLVFYFYTLIEFFQQIDPKTLKREPRKIVLKWVRYGRPKLKRPKSQKAEKFKRPNNKAEY